MSRKFRLSQKLRFAHCDAAGIGYYPRYMELCDGAIEDWTAAEIGVSRREMHLENGLGLPTVDLHARFERPGRLGDLLDFDISVHRVGRSSVDLVAEVSCASATLFVVQYTQVLTNLESMRAEPWPKEWRERLMSLAGEETSA
jgi:4-hydroxybenzoyl-CoA thioesterase